VFLCRRASGLVAKADRLAEDGGRAVREMTVSQKRGQPRLNVMSKLSLPCRSSCAAPTSAPSRQRCAAAAG
jgi:hypothetical protein